MLARARSPAGIELKILCPDCGEMNIVTITPSTCSYTTFCRRCGAVLRLNVRRSRPSSFAPPSSVPSSGESREAVAEAA